jgi:hypothetical protein
MSHGLTRLHLFFSYLQVSDGQTPSKLLTSMFPAHQCTPSISDDWDEAELQLAHPGLLQFYCGRGTETAMMLGPSVQSSLLAIADEVIE